MPTAVDVLLLGEANFSFALALRGLLEAPSHNGSEAERAVSARQLKEQLETVANYLHSGNETQMSITASCYEAPAEVLQKYPESAGILSRLSHLGVDVSRILSQFSSRVFSAVLAQVTWATPPDILSTNCRTLVLKNVLHTMSCRSHCLPGRMKRDYDHLFKLVLHSVQLLLTQSSLIQGGIPRF